MAHGPKLPRLRAWRERGAEALAKARRAHRGTIPARSAPHKATTQLLKAELAQRRKPRRHPTDSPGLFQVSLFGE